MMPRLQRHALFLLGGLVLVGLLPRPAAAQTATYCEGRLLATQFFFTPRVLNPTRTEVSLNMVLRNTSTSGVTFLVRFAVPSANTGQLNRNLSLNPGQQMTIVLAVLTDHPDLIGDLIRDAGTPYLVANTSVQCSG